MKLRNKKTGEIIDVYKGQILLHYNQGKKTIQFKSIEELEEWEDYEEPKEHWFINAISGIETTDRDETDEPGRAMIEIGNYFETREEAERAVEKLKAWKRLNDAGVSFKPTTIGHKWYLEPHASPENRTFKESQDLYKDVMLFFGGEDESNQ